MVIACSLLCSQQDNETVESFEPAKYENETTLLTVNEQAITIQPKDLDKENVYMPLSSRMGLWHGLSIRLDEKPRHNPIREGYPLTVKKY